MLSNGGDITLLQGASGEAVQQVTNPLRILFVDDDETIRDAMVAILAWFGHEMHSASRGQDAFEIYQDKTIDLVITDYQMPDMKGFELAEKIKGLRPEAKIILLTGWNAGDSSMMSPHIDRTLAKPATIQSVIDTIKELFETNS